MAVTSDPRNCYSDLDIVPRQEPQIMHRKQKKEEMGDTHMQTLKGKHWVRNIFGWIFILCSLTDTCFHSITTDIFAA